MGYAGKRINPASSIQHQLPISAHLAFNSAILLLYTLISISNSVPGTLYQHSPVFSQFSSQEIFRITKIIASYTFQAVY